MAKRQYIKKPSTKKDDWALLKKGIVVLFLLLIFAFITSIYLREKRGSERATCARMEYDAQNTLAAISDYYANPDHIDLPTYDQLVEEVDLVTTYPVKIEGDPEKDIMVTVINNKDIECPKGKKYVALMGDSGGEWKD